VKCMWGGLPDHISSSGVLVHGVNYATTVHEDLGDRRTGSWSYSHGERII
jgi:hypothetical protein